ncbi:MAG: hypothetical protein KAJ53_12130, partial [Anaerolineales bacterium]|nr:hypothetical protein [Anaerolineales bacterium]
MHALRIIVPILLISFLLASCALHEPVSVTNSWTYSELRSLDPSDTSQPSLDILAVYARHLRPTAPLSQLGSIFPYFSGDVQRVQLRLDFLDLPIRSEADIYLALDHKAGGTNELP